VLDDGVARGIEDALMVVVPMHAVVLVPGRAQHFEDLADPTRLADSVPFHDNDVSGKGLGRCLSSRHV
jgi:hypothetical protein